MPRRPQLSGFASDFVSSDEINRHKSHTFSLNGDIGRVLGKLERDRLAITIEGDQGSGKSRFSYQLANAFAEKGLQVGYFSLEMGDRSDVVKRLVNQYLSERNRPNLKISGDAKQGIDTVRKYGNAFDVIFIDSWNKLDADSREFDNLRNEFKKTIWVVIFQRTSTGVIRGGTRPLYDAGINLEAHKSGKSFSDNYIVATKNRYGESHIPYSIAKQRIISLEPEDNE
jgi:nucleoside-triphosphatase THEP1